MTDLLPGFDERLVEVDSTGPPRSATSAPFEWFEGGHTMPGLDRMLADQGRMSELVERWLRGLRWDALESPAGR